MEENALEEPSSKRAKLDNESVIKGEDDNGHSREPTDCIHIREKDVGITEYINNNVSRFSGVIKQRLQASLAC